MTNLPSYPTGGDSGSYAPPAPPADVQTSVKLWFTSIVIGLIGSVGGVFFTDTDALIAEQAQADSGLSTAELESVVMIGLVVGLVFALVIIGLQVFFVFKMRAGRNWARIVLAVLAGLSLVLGLLGLTGGITVASFISLVSLAVLVAATYYMFRPAANAYFSGHPR